MTARQGLQTERERLRARLRDGGPWIGAGLTACDPRQLPSALDTVARWDHALAHIDVMDGRFVPDLLGWTDLARSVAGKAIVDVHLMVENPFAAIAAYAQAGADILTVHPEATAQPHAALTAIAQAAEAVGRPILRGVALCPGTPIEVLRPLLPQADLVLLLAVDPGRPGGPYIDATLARAAACRALPSWDGHLLAIDGGVKRETAEGFAAAQPDILVSGSALFKAENPDEICSILRDTLVRARNDNTTEQEKTNA